MRPTKMLDAYGAWAIGFGMIKLPIIRRSVWVIDETGRLIDMGNRHRPGKEHAASPAKRPSARRSADDAAIGIPL